MNCNHNPVVIPGFPRKGAPTAKTWGREAIRLANFPQNIIKIIKKNGPKG